MRRGKLYIFYAAHIPFAPPTFTSCTQVVSSESKFFSKIRCVMLEVKQEVIRGNGKVLFGSVLRNIHLETLVSLPECKGMLVVNAKLCCRGEGKTLKALAA